MKVEATSIPDVMVITPTRHSDERGFLSEVYHRERLRSAGIQVDFVQDNHTFSSRSGTVRGLHYQEPPAGTAKLIRVTAGEIFDVALDIRPDSPTFGEHVGVELSSESGAMLYLPVGTAHGFCTLTSETHVTYKSSAYWDPTLDRGIRWNDPELGIDWPVSEDDVVVSEKDRNQPLWRDIQSPF